MAGQFRRYIAILLSFTMGVSSCGNLHAAEQPIQTTIDLLNAVRGDLANFQTALEQLVVRQATIETAQRFQSDTKEELKNQAQTKQSAAKAAMENLNKVDPKVLGDELTGKLKSCFGSLVEASDKTLSQPDSKVEKFTIPCNRDQIQSIIDQVKEKRRQALEQWEKCRAKIVNAPIPNTPNKVVDAAELPPTLPRSAGDSQSSIETYLNTLLKSFPPASEQGVCAKEMQASLAQVKDSDDTLDDVEKILEFAGTVCAASGANPYVCAVMGAFVALIELAKLLGFDHPIGKPAAGASGKVEGKPAPGTPGGKPDGFGTSSSGSITCTRNGKAITCSKTGYNSITIDPTPGDSHFIDKKPDETERRMIENAVGNGDAKKFYFCERPPGNKSFIFGFLFFEGSKYYPVSVSLIGPDAKMGFQPANDRADSVKNEELCAAFTK